MSDILGYLNKETNAFMTSETYDSWVKIRASSAEIDEWIPISKKDSIKSALETLKQEILDDGGYAIGWHDNLAMSTYDSIREKLPNVSHEDAMEIGNDMAKRFMQLLFDFDLDIETIKAYPVSNSLEDFGC